MLALRSFQLKDYLREGGVDYSAALEKSELVALYRERFGFGSGERSTTTATQQVRRLASDGFV